MRRAGMGISGELRWHGGLTGVLPGQAGKFAAVHRPGTELEQTWRRGAGGTGFLLAGGSRTGGLAPGAPAREPRRRDLRTRRPRGAGRDFTAAARGVRCVAGGKEYRREALLAGIFR